MTDIVIGNKVVAPSTDKDGEASYVMGTLTAINSRFATITQTDGTIIKVGKTKIELVEERREDERRSPDTDRRNSERLAGYVAVKCASGRKSYDKDDPTAQLLRGKTLEEVYAIAAATLITDKTVKNPHAFLRSQYQHLNPGQQRMILGNRLRRHAKSMLSSERLVSVQKPQK